MTVPDPVVIEALSHSYKRSLALDEISLTIPGGQLVGLIGPDGVGKSTLLGLIAGAKRLQDGTIEVMRGSIGDADHRRQICSRIAFMPQGLGRNLYAELSVRENLDFFARLFEQPAGERAQRIAKLLEATGLAPFPDRPAGKLSGGMRQKLGLCCALIHDPDLLLLDEPTTGVDPLSRRRFWQLLQAIRSEQPSLSVIVSTAYMDEAEGFDWLCAMDAGRIVGTGTPAELVAQTGADGLEGAYRELLPQSEATSELRLPPRLPDGDQPVISARNLTRRFGEFVAVDEVSFEIEPGEIFGFLGSNGCGKSTTMKMLTGLLPISDGEAWMLGRPVDATVRASRRDVGYMSQAFSLYGELTVAQNLQLHARLFDLPPEKRLQRLDELIGEFELEPYLAAQARALPLGVRQRLSLAVAIIHEPPVLILDEPTSGVDPEARDTFWRLLIRLSREQGVTIFLSTHFMSEAALCDRVSFMHAGQVLACAPPAELAARSREGTLEAAFIDHLEKVAPADEPAVAERSFRGGRQAASTTRFSLQRYAAYAWRETLEVLRDPVRVAFAFLGSAVLMVLFCYGISLDVEDVHFAVVDGDRSPESRAYIAEVEGSRYFSLVGPSVSPPEAQRLLVEGKVSLTIEIPPGFGADLQDRQPVTVLAVVDGALPFKGETVEGYVSGIHQRFAEAFAGETAQLATIEPRFRYNPSFESINAMAPGMPAILLILLPAILTAVSVARERELGSITNFYVTPTSRLEFLAGKQAPYIAVSFMNALILTAMVVWLFGVPLQGDLTALLLGAFLYVWASTSYGLVIATLTSSQVAAVFATAISAIVPTIQFSGLLQPVSTLDGGAQVLGRLWPASYFLHLNVGAFTKGLGWSALMPDLLALACFGPGLLLLAAALLRAQER